MVHIFISQGGQSGQGRPGSQDGPGGQGGPGGQCDEFAQRGLGGLSGQSG